MKSGVTRCKMERTKRKGQGMIYYLLIIMILYSKCFHLSVI